MSEELDPADERERRIRDLVDLRRRGKTIEEISREYRYEARYSPRQVSRLINIGLRLGVRRDDRR